MKFRLAMMIVSQRAKPDHREQAEAAESDDDAPDEHDPAPRRHVEHDDLVGVRT